MENISVSCHVFSGIQTVDIESLSQCSEEELRPILPCLVRMSLCAPLDTSKEWSDKRKLILKCLSGVEIVNNLVGLLSIDFHELEQDAKKEHELSRITKDSPLGNQGIALDFEKSDAARKLRLLLSEMLSLISSLKNEKLIKKKSELFESEIYLEELSDVLCISQAELPHLLPMTDVAEALLRIKSGSWLLCRLVANNPDSFFDVCQHLIHMASKQDIENLENERRCEWLLKLCRMNPSSSARLKSICLQQCKLASLVIWLSLENKEEDLVAFVSGILLERESCIRQWFSQFLKSNDKKRDPSSSASQLRQKLVSLLKQMLEKENLSTGFAIRGCSFLRMYASIKCSAGSKFSEEECLQVFKLSTFRPSLNQAGSRLATLSVCILLACPQLVTSEEQEAKVTSWLKWLVDATRNSKSSPYETLLLIAIYFHGNNGNAISDLVSQLLGVKCVVKAAGHPRMKVIFTTKVFTEQVIAGEAIKVPVTLNLNDSMRGHLPIHCIHQLLESRVFSKNRICIREWIHNQMSHCSLPLHPSLPTLIQLYINSILLPNAKIDKSNSPLSEEHLFYVFFHCSPSSSFFSPSSSIKLDPPLLAVQLIHLYYLLLYQDVLINNIHHLKSSNKNPFIYSQLLLSNIPIKFFLISAQYHSPLLSGLYASLLGLVSTHYPHLCFINDWLDCENINLDFNQSTSESVLTTYNLMIKQPSIEEIEISMKNLTTNSSNCCILFDQLLSLALPQLLPFCDVIVRNMVNFLKEGTPRRCQDLLLKVWTRLHIINPQLKSSTVNAFSTNQFITYSEADLIQDPLITLKCDLRVFRCPPIFQIFLKLLNCFLSMSRIYLSNHIIMNPSIDGKMASVGEREELKVALVAAQESAALQMLIEICLPLKEDNSHPTSQLGNRREIQCQVLDHLHQKFISDTSLAKLLHFQGYPLQLVPLLVKGVPSMFICLDFLPELIAQPHREKLTFAIRLVSHLSLVFPVSKCLSVAKLCINCMHTMASMLPSNQRCFFFRMTLPDLGRFCSSFPVLCDDAVPLITHLGQLVLSELSSLSPIFHFDSSQYEINSEEQEEEDDESLLERSNEENSFTDRKKLLKLIFRTFSKIVGSTAFLRIDLGS